MQTVMARVRAVGLASALAIASLGLAGAAPAAAAGPWVITVGSGIFPYTSLNRFYPNDITVHPGDTVRFNWAGFHTVTFNPPSNLSLLDFAFFGTPTASNSLDHPNTFVNGTPTPPDPTVVNPPPPPPFDLAIGEDLPAGTYHFQCQLHQFMKGVIRVKKGSLPATNGQNQTLADAQIASDQAKAVKLDNRLIKESAHSQGEALAGAGDKVTELFNFYPSFPSNITVRAGDELTFTTRDLHEPHTVTFGTEPAGGPFAAVFPSGTGNPKAYDGTSDLNSGFLFARSQYNYWNLKDSILSAAVPRTQFSVTFTTPGLYPFYCALHGGQHAAGQFNGMSGNILVLPGEGDGGDGGAHS